jgi:predicted TIM-barrel fold metal-dependent hydrolase
MAGWHQAPPGCPPTLADANRETWEASERLKWMDQHGIFSQVLYPNVQGFGTGRFLALNDPDLMLACVQAYNDFLVDFAAEAPNRFVAISALPFWDLELTIAEMKRCAALGHRGIIFGVEPEFFDQPHLTHPHWDPLWAAAQDMELSVNFHIASGNRSAKSDPWDGIGEHAKYASASVKFFMGNVRGIADLIHGGICHRFPRLKFVSVESGVGWIPYALDAMDWMWKNCAVATEHPEYDLLPSEYFRRQIYGCFWFERDTVRSAIEAVGPDNILYETDFPHPTSMSPGPASIAVSPRDYISDVLGDLPEMTLRKILHDNAAKLYHLEGAAQGWRPSTAVTVGG